MLAEGVSDQQQNISEFTKSFKQNSTNLKDYSMYISQIGMYRDDELLYSLQLSLGINYVTDTQAFLSKDIKKYRPMSYIAKTVTEEQRQQLARMEISKVIDFILGGKELPAIVSELATKVRVEFLPLNSQLGNPVVIDSLTSKRRRNWVNGESVATSALATHLPKLFYKPYTSFGHWIGSFPSFRNVALNACRGDERIRPETLAEIPPFEYNTKDTTGGKVFFNLWNMPPVKLAPEQELDEQDKKFLGQHGIESMAEVDNIEHEFLSNLTHMKAYERFIEHLRKHGKKKKYPQLEVVMLPDGQYIQLKCDKTLEYYEAEKERHSSKLSELVPFMAELGQSSVDKKRKFSFNQGGQQDTILNDNPHIVDSVYAFGTLLTPLSLRVFRRRIGLIAQGRPNSVSKVLIGVENTGHFDGTPPMPRTMQMLCFDMTQILYARKGQLPQVDFIIYNTDEFLPRNELSYMHNKIQELKIQVILQPETLA